MNRPHLPKVLHRHPFELAVAIILLITGARSLYNQDALPSSIDHLPELFGIVYRLTLALAGILILVGLLSKTTLGPALEQAGLWLAGTVFAAYGLAAMLVGLHPAATFFGATLFAIAGACGLRARAIAQDQRTVGYVLLEARRQGEPHD